MSPDPKSPPLPNFFLLGAAKAGTTALCRMLKMHPEIYMSRVKETQFFFNGELYGKGLDFYADTYFSGARGYPARGEASPSYFHHPTLVAPRMLDTLDSADLKFIVLLRDPAERAYSHYLHRVRICEEKLPFAEALEMEERRLAHDPLQWVGYYRDGLYGKLVTQWFNYFPRKQFLFIPYEGLEHDWRSALTRICVHLRVVPEFDWSKNEVVNRAATPRSRLFMRFLQNPPSSLRSLEYILGRERAKGALRVLRRLNSKAGPKPILDKNMEWRLRQLYAPDIELLETLLGQDFRHWKVASSNVIGARTEAYPKSRAKSRRWGSRE